MLLEIYNFNISQISQLKKLIDKSYAEARISSKLSCIKTSTFSYNLVNGKAHLLDFSDTSLDFVPRRTSCVGDFMMRKRDLAVSLRPYYMVKSKIRSVQPSTQTWQRGPVWPSIESMHLNAGVTTYALIRRVGATKARPCPRAPCRV